MGVCNDRTACARTRTCTVLIRGSASETLYCTSTCTSMYEYSRFTDRPLYGTKEVSAGTRTVCLSARGPQTSTRTADSIIDKLGGRV